MNKIRWIRYIDIRRFTLFGGGVLQIVQNIMCIDCYVDYASCKKLCFYVDCNKIMYTTLITIIVYAVCSLYLSHLQGKN